MVSGFVFWLLASVSAAGLLLFVLVAAIVEVGERVQDWLFDHLPRVYEALPALAVVGLVCSIGGVLLLALLVDLDR